MEAVTSLKARTDYLTTQYDLNKRAAIALQLSELGYSNSGIASKLDVTTGTVNKYQAQAEEQIGPRVWEALPKSQRYDTFPSDNEESEYAGDHIQYSDDFKQRQRPLNKGSVDWENISADDLTNIA